MKKTLLLGNCVLACGIALIVLVLIHLPRWTPLSRLIVALCNVGADSCDDVIEGWRKP